MSDYAHFKIGDDVVGLDANARNWSTYTSMIWIRWLVILIAFLAGFVLFAPFHCSTLINGFEITRCTSLVSVAVPGDGSSSVSFLPGMAAGGAFALIVYVLTYMLHRH